MYGLDNYSRSYIEDKKLLKDVPLSRRARRQMTGKRVCHNIRNRYTMRLIRISGILSQKGRSNRIIGSYQWLCNKEEEGGKTSPMSSLLTSTQIKGAKVKRRNREKRLHSILSNPVIRRPLAPALISFSPAVLFEKTMSTRRKKPFRLRGDVIGRSVPLWGLYADISCATTLYMSR